MFYSYTMNGDFIAYDNESGALLLVDEAAYELLAYYQENNQERPNAKTCDCIARKTGVPVGELALIADEIDALIRSGTLFAPSSPVTLEQLYPEPPRLKSMCLNLCHDCNLRCRYCFAGTGDFGTGQRKRMPLETGKRAVDFLIEASGPRRNLDIDFFGGEPLLNWDVVVGLTRYCESEGPRKGKQIRLTLTTNATLLDDEKADFLNAHMKNVVLSVDGRPEVHDAMRPNASGKGSYAVAMKNIHSFAMKRGEREYYLRGTYTSKNLDFAEDIRHFVKEGFKQLSLEPVVASPDSDYAIKQEDLPRVLREYEILAADYLKAGREGHPYNFFHFHIDVEGGPCLYKKMKGCGVGTEYCAVTPDGDIYPCHQFVGEPEFLLGNIYAAPALNPPKSLMERLNRLILPEKAACQNCWARYFCGGGCAANAWHASGTLDGCYEMGCELQRKRLEAALWVQAKLREERDIRDA